MRKHLNKLHIVVVFIFIQLNGWAQSNQILTYFLDSCNRIENYNGLRTDLKSLQDSFDNKTFFCFYNGYSCIDCFKEIQAKEDLNNKIFYLVAFNSTDYQTKRNWFKLFKTKNIKINEKNTLFIIETSCGGILKELIEKEKSPFLIRYFNNEYSLIPYQNIFNSLGDIKNENLFK